MKLLDHPYQNLSGGRWLRGNLHAHSDRSDGTSPVAEVVAAYAARGYDFLMISDHDLLFSQDDCAQFAPDGFILLPGNEITGGGTHLLHVGAPTLVPAEADRQRVFDAINAAGGFAIVNHPAWIHPRPQGFTEHCPLADLLAWTGYAGLEIYNGVIGDLAGSPYALEKWDRLLSLGRRVWGFANDDLHFPRHVGLGWNVAYVREPTAAGVLEALQAGRFYASTGVVITAIEVDGRRVRIETQNAERIVCYREWGRRGFRPQEAAQRMEDYRLHAGETAQADATWIEVEVPASAHFVRFECWGRGESFAWTQPFWVVDGEA